MELRWYQHEAIEAAYRFLRERPNDNPCIVLPTGAGKTPVLSSICRDAVEKWGGRVLVLSHVKELVEQSATTLQRWYPGLDVGIYSAGVGKRDVDNSVIVAGIQSVHSRAFELCGTSPFNLVIVDEAHRIPLSGDGMYRQFFDDLRTANPRFRVIGLTATNYRTDGGYVTGQDYVLSDVCFEASVRQLIAQGFLARLTSKQATNCADLSEVKVVRGEFSDNQMADEFEKIVESAVDEIVEQSKDRKSVLLFCAGRSHMLHVIDEIRNRGHEIYGVDAKTPTNDREELVEYFKTGKLKFLANINVFTEGFDAPNVDMVCLLRATVSPGLYYQMVGRGLRICEGKADCKVLDFGGNVERHGCIDAMQIKKKKVGEVGEAPTKTCPNCQEIVPIQYQACGECGFEFPEPEAKERHGANATNEAILSEDIPTVEHEVDKVTYHVHYKRNAPDDAPRTMRVSYFGGELPIADEWVCIEHEGWANTRAAKWWKERCSLPMPGNVENAVQVGDKGGLAEPFLIRTKKRVDSRFLEIVGYELGDVPEPVEVVDGLDDEELPF